MKTVAIIQAHMGSSRLPGKVLMDLGGESMLATVLDRVGLCTLVDQTVVATSVLPADDPIVTACGFMNIPVFRGSESDVLDRFYQAAQAYSADVCVRITSDCPLIDPGLTDEIIRRFNESDPQVDYASNKIPQSYPRGLDTEVFTVDVLHHAWQRATEAYERAHVTIYIYEHPEQYRLLSVTSDVDRSEWRWTVDAPEDLEFVRQVYARLDAGRRFAWTDVLALIEREPWLHGINRGIVQKPVRAG